MEAEQVQAMMEQVTEHLMDQISLKFAEQAAQQSAFREEINARFEKLEFRLVALEAKSRSPSPTLFFDATGMPVTPANKGAKSTGDDSSKNNTGNNGGSSTSNTGNSSGNNSGNNAKKPDRRDTMHLHSVKTSEAVSTLPLVHGVLASSDHIRYKKSSIRSFFEFWELVNDYELRERTTLPVNTLIEKTVREHLISTDRSRLGTGKFYSLSREELYNLMQEQFRPADKLDFMKQLENNVEFEFKTNFRPTPEYFRPFYDALLSYISNFTKIFEILSYGSDDLKQNIPRCDSKPGGLVKAFVGKIPFEYGTRTLLLLEDTKWPTLLDFIRDFQKIMDQHKEDAEKARKLRRTFGGTQYEAKKFDQKLQHLQALRAAFADDFDEDIREAAELEAEELDEELDDLLAAAMEQSRGKDFPKKTPYDKNAPQRDPLVCITKLLHGTCTKTPCNYSHKEDLVAKKRLEFMDLIQKQLAAAKPQRTFAPHKVAVLENSYEDDGY
uniref:Uncharacterized protein n=1 Tax=Spumella elongata TaxID=89044 RepID=A0A7S3MF74_9STRA|mmetsp:Transcript_55081/g.96415  ORF Transcript_55081/g.96415 Transcript_55081/m.96415 type:complete len:497 (+) Transcript_55081:58-1548(+)